MPAAGIRLGVDFGTSNTVAVVRWPDSRARTLLFDGSPLLPSAVYAEPNGHLVVGRDAVHSARLDPARFEPNPKRRIDEGSVLLGDRELTVNQLVGAVLGRISEECRRTVGEMPGQITITCPASWGATRRLVLSDAAESAGLGSVRLVAEPVAAATYFTQVLGRDVPIGSVVVVHDFGAGTFDASVVARTSSGFEVLAVDGRDDIGGLDIDEAVVAHIGKTCVERDPDAWQRLLAPSTVEERRARRLLWDDARVAKERLSRNPTADVTVPLLNSDVHLTREELEALARPLLDQTVRVTQGVIRWANLAEGRLAGVFLVGGSSRIPLVATLLHRAMGEAPVAIEQPELVVAEGSIHAGAASMPSTGGAAPGPSGPRGPAGPVPPVGPPPGRPVSGTPFPSGPVTPVSVTPVSGTPVSGPPVSGLPVSGPPVSGAPVSGGPTAAVSPATPVSPARQVSPNAGRVIVPGSGPPGTNAAPQPVAPTRPMQRFDRPAVQAPVVRPAPRPPAGQQPAYQYPPSGYLRTPAGRRSPARRAVVILLVIVLLVLTPVVAGYISYWANTGQWPPPVNSWFPSQ
jgi:Ethanolamine utilization protein EutJ (predicted chaperonin)